jgi:hypothetical protein
LRNTGPGSMGLNNVGPRNMGLKIRARQLGANNFL